MEGFLLLLKYLSLLRSLATEISVKIMDESWNLLYFQISSPSGHGPIGELDFRKIKSPRMLKDMLFKNLNYEFLFVEDLLIVPI